MAKSQKHHPMPPQLRLAGPAILLGLITTGLLLAAFSCILVRLGALKGLCFTMGSIALCAGCFVAAYVGARLRKSGGLLCGFLSFLFYVLILVAAAILYGSRSVETASLIRVLLLLPSGLAGGILGLYSSEKRARRRHS